MARRDGRSLLMGLKNDPPVGSGCWWTVDSPTVEDTMLIRTHAQIAHSKSDTKSRRGDRLPTKAGLTRRPS